ncbi:vitamin B12 ABC transporter permease BtuC [Halovenus sp. WSH3]|uniref:Vitamin B12 ABC transporter permease BtuC n=1 Tax=Halovenus carboxidivorans TaxID=2692199 RepID=A0A6B0TBW9_9EURY|nr:vitamin B12 ABC transporter permease BtuC [Halovenus carboxidivorans]MXR52882.1 vitamin B12 ABC transporter permease BtuC [Halovenus carboxidivorans]
MRIGARVLAWSAGLSAVLVGTVVVSATIGPVDIGAWTVAKALVNTVSYPSGLDLAWSQAGVGGHTVGVPVPDVTYAQPFDLAVAPTDEIIVQEIRLPRILLGAIVGFALATAGTVMQGFFRNPMADPSIIGVSSGAAVGAVATIAFPLALPFGLQTAAFVGALVAAFGVYLVATEDGRTPVATLLLAGLAIQTFLGAVVSYMLLYSGESLEEAILWLMGHLRFSSWSDVEATLPVTVVTFAVLLVYARDLNVMLLGEEDADALGIEVERTKRILLAGASIITAAGVAVTGVIGFVGLIIPHIMRLIVGPDHRILLPTSALAGAIFLVAADTLARSGPAEVPVGIVTAAVGAPFFLFLLRRREVHAL